HRHDHRLVTRHLPRHHRRLERDREPLQLVPPELLLELRQQRAEATSAPLLRQELSPSMPGRADGPPRDPELSEHSLRQRKVKRATPMTISAPPTSRPATVVGTTSP